MEHPAYWALEKKAAEPKHMDETIFYVAKCLERFLRKREYVLICFPKQEFEALGTIFEQAVLQLDAIPIFWGPDRKWKTLLRQAFASRATTIIAPPKIVLGLSKLTKATGTPLSIRNAVTAGYPCPDWMIDGFIRGLDCRTWGCFGPGTGALVSGFSCGCSRGVHLRHDRYDIQILDHSGEPLPEGEFGLISVASLEDPKLRYVDQDLARLDRTPCACGQTAPRLMDITPGRRCDADVMALRQELHSWTSILDCRVEKSFYGLEIELVVFPGEKLPKLPTCAKRVIRPWVPDLDGPLDMEQDLGFAGFSGENH